MNGRWLRDFVVWWSVALTCLVTAITGTLWALPLAWAALGVAQHAIGNLAHEGLHFQITTRRGLNEVLTNLCAAPLGMNVRLWRRWHMRHHAFLGQPGDPEVALKCLTQVRWRRPQVLRDALGLGAGDMARFWMSVHLGDVARSLNAPWLIWGTVTLFGGWPATALWFIALATSQVVAFRLRTKAEHPIDALHVTPSREKPSIWVRATYLPCNSWDHWAHHKWPAIRSNAYPFAA